MRSWFGRKRVEVPPSPVAPKRPEPVREDIGPPAHPDGRYRVVFLCFANACRSQMAEAFARELGKDVLVASSAGVEPLGYVPDEVGDAMAEAGLSVEGQASKALSDLEGEQIDLIVDLAGVVEPRPGGIPVWQRRVVDPFGRGKAAFRMTRDVVRVEVEGVVRALAASR